MSDAKDDIVRGTAWQQKLLPLMARMLAGLTVFFFVASFGQLFYLHSRIERAPTVDVLDLIRPRNVREAAPLESSLAAQRLAIAATLESNAIARRYHQANVILMARVWSNYLGFVTGMTLALVGAAFILGQLQTSGNEAEAKSAAFQFTLRTASPGLTLCFLGVLLMITTIISPQEISTQDVPVYFGKDALPDGPAGKPRLQLDAPAAAEASPPGDSQG